MNDLSSEAKLLLRRAREEFSPGEGRLEAVRASLAIRTAAGDATSQGGSNAPTAGGASGVNAVRAAAWTTAHTAGAAFVAGALVATIYALVPRAEKGDAPREMRSASHVVAHATGAPVHAPAVDLLVAPAAPVAEPASDNELHSPSTKIPISAIAPMADARHERPSEVRAAAPPLRSAARIRGRVETPAEAPAVPVNGAAVPAAAPQNTAPAPQNVAPPASAVAQVDDSLSDEVHLLREARGALDRGDPARALSSLDAHEARFVRGTLYEERLATRVQAFCALGRIDSARIAAQELERIAPRSPHLVRVRTSCVASPPSK